MGLLDKVDNSGTKEEKPKAQPKPTVAKKAEPKATPKPAKAKSKKEKSEKLRPSGLPEGYELAGKMPRYIGWLINFGWNFGALIGTLSIFIFGDPDLTESE